MSKQFNVAPGFLVRIGSLWHDSQAPLFIEEDEEAAIYLDNRGLAGCCLGIYAYAGLDSQAPPMGLRCARCRSAGNCTVALAGGTTGHIKGS
jgi:hypothetical protein